MRRCITISFISAFLLFFLAGGVFAQTSGDTFTFNLKIGSRDAATAGQVSKLQEFLKKLGTEIYPEGLVTGYYGALSARAVTRFQEKYASEILLPVGLAKGTGFFGASSRAKLNALVAARA